MAEAPAFGISDCHSELVDAGPGPPKSAVDIGAFTEFCEQALRQLHIAVDLPQPRAFVVHGVVFNEPPDILRRIADEQSSCGNSPLSRKRLTRYATHCSLP